jgi:predicted RNA binding protein with dsRBD fold (UPF0201 family)
VADIELRIEASINPTEDVERVKKAMENVFGELKFQEKRENGGTLITALEKGAPAAEMLSRFGKVLRREHIRDAARVVLLRGIVDGVITFHLNKQVAFAGHISFSGPVAESPLGPISVRISSDEPTALINSLAPRTV